MKDVKYQQKKQREEQVRLQYKYDSVKQKLKDQNRLLEKIRSNAHRGHNSRSASKVRDIDLVSRKNFGVFLGQLYLSFDLVFTRLDEAFKRDAFLTKTALACQYNSNGTIMIASKEAHEATLRFS
jgi:hypothetical protein